MNVIFVDFDGVLCADINDTNEEIEKRIILLKEICKKYNASVVISSAHKEELDEETLEFKEDAVDYTKFVVNTMRKHGIDIKGVTPTLKVKTGCTTRYLKKGYEVIKYLSNHLEIKHFCILDDELREFEIDDDGLTKEHLVLTYIEAERIKDSILGLLPSHKEMVGEILKKEIENKKIR